MSYHNSYPKGPTGTNYVPKMEGYLDIEKRAGKKSINELAIVGVKIEWKSKEEGDRLMRRSGIKEDRLEVIFKEMGINQGNYSIGIIHYKKLTAFKGLKPFNLMIYPNGQNTQKIKPTSQDCVAALKYDQKKRQIVILYPKAAIPGRLKSGGFDYTIQETYDLINLGYGRDRKNLKNFEEHQNLVIRDILLGRQKIVKKDYSRDLQAKRDFYGLNASQGAAMMQIFNNSVTLVQGPPGTGKTTLISSTILETVRRLKQEELTTDLKQKLKLGSLSTYRSNIRTLKLLVCADSNQGTNNICLSLIKKMEDKKFPKINFIRWMSPQSYVKHEHDQKLEKYIYTRCLKKDEKERQKNMSEQQRKLQKKLKVIKILECDVIFCTLMTASIIEDSIRKQLKYKESRQTTSYPQSRYDVDNVSEEIQFPYSIVDEASQTTQPRVLGALKKSARRFVLVGDPKQLGPVVHNKGIEKDFNSLFESLIGKGGNYCCFLDTQYRMHPSLSIDPNRAFYGGRIKDGPQGHPTPGLTNQLRSLFTNVNQRKIFYDVNVSEKFADKSFYNLGEIQQAIELVNKLKNVGVCYSEVGIIATYNTQVSRLKLILESYLGEGEYRKLKIGTVDSFQGSEKDFIILSTVRSNREGKIGFVKDSRRMNVALTRAKHGLFIIGNARTLERRRGNWKDLLKGYRQKGLVKASGSFDESMMKGLEADIKRLTKEKISREKELRKKAQKERKKNKQNKEKNHDNKIKSSIKIKQGALNYKHLNQESKSGYYYAVSFGKSSYSISSGNYQSSMSKNQEKYFADQAKRIQRQKTKWDGIFGDEIFFEPKVDDGKVYDSGNPLNYDGESGFGLQNNKKTYSTAKAILASSNKLEPANTQQKMLSSRPKPTKTSSSSYKNSKLHPSMKKPQKYPTYKPTTTTKTPQASSSRINNKLHRSTTVAKEYPSYKPTAKPYQSSSHRSGYSNQKPTKSPYLDNSLRLVKSRKETSYRPRAQTSSLASSSRLKPSYFNSDTYNVSTSWRRSEQPEKKNKKKNVVLKVLGAIGRGIGGLFRRKKK